MTKNFLASVGFAALLTAPALAQDASTVIATVDGTEITLGHVIATRTQLPPEYQQVPDDALMPAIIDQLIQQEAVASSMRGEVSNIVQLSIENDERALIAAHTLEGIAEAPLDEAEVQAAYDATHGSTEPTQEYNASHILVETEEEATALITELEGGAEFAALAREHSTGPSGPNGGQLGWFSAGMMVPAFEAAVMELAVGEVSPPVETRFGWHVVILNDLRDQAAPTLEEVRGEIEDQLRHARVQAYIAERMEAAVIERSEVEIDPTLLQDTDLLEQ